MNGASHKQEFETLLAAALQLEAGASPTLEHAVSLARECIRTADSRRCRAMATAFADDLGGFMLGWFEGIERRF